MYSIVLQAFVGIADGGETRCAGTAEAAALTFFFVTEMGCAAGVKVEVLAFVIGSVVSVVMRVNAFIVIKSSRATGLFQAVEVAPMVHSTASGVAARDGECRGVVRSIGKGR